MASNTARSNVSLAAASVAALALLAGCGFSPYDMPLPGGADTGDKPYTVTAEFRDVLDLVPQSGVRVNDLPVGKVTNVELKGWTAKVTLKINGDVKLPENSTATLRQTSLLGEKFVSLDAPESGGVGQLSDGDSIELAQTGRNPEIEEVFSAASLLLNGGGLERTNTIIKELNAALEGNEPEIKELLQTSEQFLGQLDNNKQQLLSSLEKVNRLAMTTNQQKDAINDALDTLPGGLRTINAQRGDLVKLLKSLDRLSGVATDVIARSKEDTIADLKALTPTLRNLAVASDDLAYDFRVLLTYPFADSTVGGSYARASADCTPSGPKNPSKPAWCRGDFANLSIRAQLGQEDVGNLLSGLFPATGQAPSASLPTSGGTPAADVVNQLAEQLARSPVLDGLSGGQRPQNPGGSGNQESPEANQNSDGNPVCSVLGLCRPAARSSQPRDLTDLLLEGTGGSR